MKRGEPKISFSGESEELLLCQACPRLVGFREQCALRVPPRFREEVRIHGFWGRPVPSFGDSQASLAIVGLAPGAFGANRTGRMFTGDRSGEFLFSALHRAGLANQPYSKNRGDGLVVSGVFITAALRCVPPQNRPTAEELARCLPFLRQDLAGLSQLKVVLALGRVAHDAVVTSFSLALRPQIKFSHGKEVRLPDGLWLVDSYHVSQQNTFTKRLTAGEFDRILQRCLALAAGRG